MKIETAQFGAIDVSEDKIIIMPAGMPGFPGRGRFVILEREETRPFYWYQCVDDADLAFVIMNPYLFRPDYSVDLKPAVKEMSWEADGENSLKIYVIVNASNGTPEKITANLIGPLVINTRKHEAVQMVVYDSQYSHKHPILNQ
ncbi:MAG: flagellar assembly protein FliW [Desulfobacterales bacterium]|nr:flagellar assembly protein FliW [Desulfobacterales bacterium]